LKISNLSLVVLVIQNVKLVTVLNLKIVSLVKLLLSIKMLVSSTYMMRKLKNVTKLVLLTNTKSLMKTSVSLAVKTVLFAIKLTKVDVLPVTLKLFSLLDNVTNLVHKDNTWVN
jgi:hypothetical protein